MVDSVESLVVGAGVVGLAIARALAVAGNEVLVVEQEALIGSITSSRNSEVIHAGIYYPPKSRKASLCVHGKEMLYDYCEARGIPYRRCGKLIVVTDASEVPALEDIANNAAASGVTDLELIDGAAARGLEPSLRCHSALLSPSTGIIDSHQFMTALAGDISSVGGTVATHASVVSARRGHGRLRVVVADGSGETVEIECCTLVNAAGLGAQALATCIDGMPRDRIPRQYLTKGSYFILGGRPPFSRLVYPLPTTASLGLHYSIDLGGQIRFGPDVQWVERIDYTVDGARAAPFEESIRRYFPDLPKDALEPGYAGIRPKVVGPGSPAGDFIIQGPEAHGVRGLVNLFGIESPGLTASLAIGETVQAMLND